MNQVTLQRYSRLAWATLALNVLVILWGAYVRATGSGAGCGSHWPLCNGEVIPVAATTATAIEFIHRLSSGLAMIFVLALLVWGWRAYPARHGVRAFAAAAGVFVVLEALIGAGLVIFELVAGNTSLTRGVVGALHLANTYLLLGALTCLALLARWPSARRCMRDRSLMAWLATSLLGLLIVGMSGAVVALGDTLFRPATLVEGIRAELAPASHLFVRLRVVHPVLALGCSVVVGAFAWQAQQRSPGPSTARLGIALWVTLGAQLVLGVVNVALLAPVPIQILHLLLSDASWILAVALGIESLTQPPALPSGP